MTARQKASLKFLIEKLSLSPSTRKSWFQIVVSLLITLSLVGVIAWLENEQKDDKSQTASQLTNQTKPERLNIKNTLNNTLPKIANQSEADKKDEKKCEYQLNVSTIICLISDSKLLGQLQNIGVLSAAILFFWNTFDTKKQLERQAWQLIDGAQGS
ncbi:MAG: hypothetical protein H0X31_05675, partial [Nostocaceae cyanobacterium]|nr:hypothetical protein [Nostocaceae cyanobacterium]